jgi:hypothetical protein
MIKGITGGNFVNVLGGHASGPYISPGSSGAGIMRYNGNTQTIEVNDGISWQALNAAYPSVELNGRAVSILEWAEQKMMEEQQLNELCKKYPGLERARSNFETFRQLVLAEESTNSTVQSSP